MRLKTKTEILVRFRKQQDHNLIKRVACKQDYCSKKNTVFCPIPGHRSGTLCLPGCRKLLIERIKTAGHIFTEPETIVDLLSLLLIICPLQFVLIKQ